MNGNGVLRWTPVVVLFLASAACDSSFRSGAKGGEAGPAPALGFSFGDGTDQQELLETDTLHLRITIPEVGYRKVLSNGSLDPSRVVLRAIPAVDGVENLTEVLAAEGLVDVGDAVDGSFPVEVEVPLRGPVEFPAGVVVLELRVIDDIDRASASLRVELTIRSAEKPIVSVRLEIPPDAGSSAPSGRLLPFDEQGDAVVGENLPFVLVVAALPAPAEGSAFERLLDGGDLDLARFVVVADRDLGDPTSGGLAAGENLGVLFGGDLVTVFDPDTGGFVAAAAVERGGPLLPPLDEVEFVAVVQDDRDVLSDPRPARLLVEPELSLERDLHPALAVTCATVGCHAGDFPVFDIDLSTPESTVATTVGVDTRETPDDSCAPWVVAAYDPDASYLRHKVVGTHRDECVQGSGDLMPPFGDPLDADAIEALTRWIRQGAHRN